MDARAAAVIEVLGRDGQVRATHKLQAWPVLIGRSPDCDIVLDDSHLAATHARLSLGDAGPQLALLPSLNGGQLGRRRLASGESVSLGPGAVFQLGASQLRLRRSSDGLAPEQPLLLAAGPPPLRWLMGLMLLWLAALWLDQWSSLNPGSPSIAYAAALLTPLGLLLSWAALWALVTQLFQHRFPFATHLWRALVGVALLSLLGALLPLLAYSFSLRQLLTLEGLIYPVGLAGLVVWHGSLVWPRGRRALTFGVLGFLICSQALVVAKRLDQQYWFGPPYLSALPPPALRLVAPKPPEALIDSLRPLEAELARQAKKDEEERSEDGGEE